MIQNLYDSEVEWDVIASCVYSPTLIPAVMRAMSTADFGSDKTAQVWEAIRTCHLRGAVDASLVASEMMSRGADPKLTLKLFDADRNSRTLAENAPHHARRLHANSLLRRLVSAGQAITELVTPGADPEVVISTAAKMLRALGEDVASSDIVDFEAATKEWERNVERVRDPARLVSTKIPSVDRMLGGGLHPGRFYVVGSRPGVGKSTFVSSITRTALDKGVRTLFMSLEMPVHEVVDRLLANAHGPAASFETTANVLWSDRAQEWPVLFLTSGDMLSLLGRARETPDVGLIVVDYLQLVGIGHRADRNREREIAEMTRDLKLLAIELDVPLLVASQVNRAPTGRASDKPRMSDLRESGSIENDADVVMLLHRDQGMRRGSLAVAKNRHGETGGVVVEFAAETMAFHEITT